MRHSDGKLTDKIYTDENLLDTRAAIEGLPSYGKGLSQGVSQSLGAAQHLVAQAVTGCVGVKSEKTPVNIGQSHALALVGTTGHNFENGGSDGARPHAFLQISSVK
jgi:hypothetical protein